jgi:hypothetical protein
MWREFRIELVGKRRDDGSLFVTSPNLRPFSAVIHDGNWEEVLQYLQKFLEVNVGPVRGLRLIHDASELIRDNECLLHELPPAFVIAEITAKGAHVP